MTAVIQRVKHASVTADGAPAGSCRAGMLVLLGVAAGDTESDADLLADKTAALRIFGDENGKMNLSAVDTGAEALVVSNFTLLASCRRGNRPDFFAAAAPDEASALYERFADRLSAHIHTDRGVFGADMQITMRADGPVTIILDTAALKAPKRKHDDT